jgi:hypothetical protein
MGAKSTFAGRKSSNSIVRGPDLTAFPDKLELDPLCSKAEAL